jgi:hypothetical protein
VGNEQLRQALRNAGLEVDDLAVKAEVDVKTVLRWLSGRTPRARYRRRGRPQRVGAGALAGRGARPRAS